MATAEKGTGGFFQVRDGDWDEVNRALRYLCNSIDAVMGRRGSIPLATDLDMNNHKAINAEDPTGEQDLVTKHYGDMHYLQNPAAVSNQTVATGGAFAPALVNNEIPGGAIDGINTVFTLANIPATDSLAFYVKGVLQEPGVDYTLVGATITTMLPPLAGSYMRAFYQH